MRHAFPPKDACSPARSRTATTTKADVDAGALELEATGHEEGELLSAKRGLKDNAWRTWEGQRRARRQSLSLPVTYSLRLRKLE